MRLRFPFEEQLVANYCWYACWKL